MYEEYLIYAIIAIGIIYGYLKCGKMNKTTFCITALFAGLVGAIISAAIMSSGNIETIINNLVAVATFVGFMTFLFTVGVLVPLTASYLSDLTFKLKSKNTSELKNQ